MKFIINEELLKKMSKVDGIMLSDEQIKNMEEFLKNENDLITKEINSTEITHNPNLQVDYILRILYQVKDGGMIWIKQSLEENKIFITDGDLSSAENKIKSKGLGTFQNGKNPNTGLIDFRGSIDKTGIIFVETTSYYDNQTPIIKLFP